MGIALKTLAISAAMIWGSLPAHAQDDPWHLYAKGSTGSLHYIHTSRVKKTSSARVEVWSKEILKKPESIYVGKPGPMYAYSVARFEVDCNDETSAFRGITFHRQDGSVVTTNNRQEDHSPAAPDTIGEVFVGAACRLLSRQ
jgi:hypothetical protein